MWDPQWAMARVTRLLHQHPTLGPETTHAKSSSSAVPCLVLGFLSSFAQVKLPLETSTHVQGQKWAENSDGGRSPNAIENTPLMLMRYYEQEQRIPSTQFLARRVARMRLFVCADHRVRGHYHNKASY